MLLSRGPFLLSASINPRDVGATSRRALLRPAEKVVSDRRSAMYAPKIFAGMDETTGALPRKHSPARWIGCSPPAELRCPNSVHRRDDRRASIVRHRPPCARQQSDGRGYKLPYKPPSGAYKPPFKLPYKLPANHYKPPVHTPPIPLADCSCAWGCAAPAQSGSRSAACLLGRLSEYQCVAIEC
jgi:hypothetical protein